MTRIQEHAAPIVVPRWKIVLEAGVATVSEPVTARARLIVPLGSDQPDVSLSWFRAGIPVGRSAPGTFERSFTFSEEGAVSIGAAAVDSTGAGGESATLVLQVRGVHGVRAIASVQKTLATAEHIQTVFAGAIILAGWLIFSPSFIGTFPELFAAFLWRFSADVGAAKVRELASGLEVTLSPILNSSIFWMCARA